jgi:hypothetical protein
VRHIQLSNNFNAWRYWSRHENRKQNLEHNRPYIQSRIQASIESIVSHLPKAAHQRYARYSSVGLEMVFEQLGYATVQVSP